MEQPLKIHFTRKVCEKDKAQGLILKAINHKGKYWSPDTNFTYKFIGGTEQQHKHVNDGIAKIKSVAPRIKFTQVQSNEESIIRISFNPNLGAWSYVGTDNKFISQDNPTMNLGWQESTHRVVIHEFFHMLNFSHEHIRGINFDKLKIYARYATQGWTKDDVDDNFFTFDEESHDFTPIDMFSIMLYYIECSLTIDGKNCGRNNVTMSETDIKRLNEMFPPNEVIKSTQFDKHTETILKSLFKTKKQLNKITKKNLINLLEVEKFEFNQKDRKSVLLDKIWLILYNNEF